MSPAHRVGAGALLFAVGSCALAGRATAQGTSPGASPWNWVVSLLGESAWESNVRLEAPGHPGDQVSRVNGLAQWTFERPRGHFAASGIGSISRYRTASDLNQITYDLTLDGARRVTPRLEVNGRALYLTRLTSNVGVSGPGLAILPLSLSHTAGGAVGASYRISPLTSGAVSAAYTHISFNSPLLIGGGAADVRATVSRRYSPNATIGLVVEGQQGSTQGQTLATQTAAAAWDLARQRLSGRLQAGATRSSAGAAAHVQPTGAAELRSRVGAGAVSIHYARTVAQAFGLGVLLGTDQVAVAYDRASIFGVVMHASADRSWSSDRSVSTGHLVTTGAVLDLRRVFRTGFTLSGGGYVRRLERDIALTGSGVRIAAGYTFRRH